MPKRIVSVVATALLFFSFMPSVSFAEAPQQEVLQVGIEDEWVFSLQEKLIEVGYLNPPATGYFGMDTQNALIEFQKDNALVADGKAGVETLQALLGFTFEEGFAFGNNNTEQRKSTFDLGDGKSSFFSGDKGETVLEIQTRLKELEYYDYATTTGYYGPLTVEAVKRFQRSNGLVPDGSLEAESLALLFSDSAKYYTMCLNDSGADIEELQQRLLDLGYFDTAPTGYYGNLTANAVSLFQDKNGLPVDGEADQQTRILIYSNNASKLSVSTTEANAKEDASVAISVATGVSKVIEIAKEQEGKPYSYGSSGPYSYDCSGFVYYVLKNSGVATSKLSAASYATVSNWTTVSNISTLALGDLVFFKSDNDDAIDHMGIYLGGGSFIHASPSAQCVKVSGMSSGYYLDNFVTAKRIF